jgi:hypothetical protein
MCNSLPLAMSVFSLSALFSLCGNGSGIAGASNVFYGARHLNPSPYNIVLGLQQVGFMKRWALPVTLGLVLGTSVGAWADAVTVGDLEFNQPFQGVNDFAVSNFTGTNNLGFFPAADDLMFEGIVLQLTEAGGAIDICNIASLGPGTDTSCQFPDTTSFTHAVFTATLSPTTFNLTNGLNGTFVPLPLLSFTLLPSSGPTLVPNTDLGLIDAAPVPEPGTWMLFAAGSAGILGLRRRRIGRRS